MKKRFVVVVVDAKMNNKKLREWKTERGILCSLLLVIVAVERSEGCGEEGVTQ